MKKERIHIYSLHARINVHNRFLDVAWMAQQVHLLQSPTQADLISPDFLSYKLAQLSSTVCNKKSVALYLKFPMFETQK